jgi:hypothetical protein
VEGDDLLQHLGRHVRSEASPDPADDPVWERLARGELSPSEDALLRERAAGDPQVAALYEAYCPLDGAVRKRIAARVEAGLRPSRGPVWRRVALIAAPLAAAAAVLLVVSVRMRQPAEPLALIPQYALALSGGDRATRSGAPDDSGPVELHRGSNLEIVLRPSTAVSHPVMVRAFLLQGAEARPWDVPMDRSADGAVRIAGQAGALLAGAAPGSWDLVFTVGPEGSATPDAADVARAAHGDGGAHAWQLLVTRVRLLDGT